MVVISVQKYYSANEPQSDQPIHSEFSFIEQIIERVAQFNDILASSKLDLLPLDCQHVYIKAIISHHSTFNGQLDLKTMSEKLQYIKDEIVSTPSLQKQLTVQMVYKLVSDFLMGLRKSLESREQINLKVDEVLQSVDSCNEVGLLAQKMLKQVREKN